MRIQVNLKARLVKERSNGAPITFLLAHVALFASILFLRKTTFFTKYDENGFKTAMLYYVTVIVLLSLKFHLSQPNFDPTRPLYFKPNLTANLLLGFVIGINSGGFFEISLFSFCTTLTLSVLFLLVLVITKQTDLGFFGFLVGTVGSVGSMFFGFTSTTWVVAAICVFLLGSKFWLDKNWLEVEKDQDRPTTGSVPKLDQFILLLPFLIFLLQLDRDLFRTKCRIGSEPARLTSCSSVSLLRLIASVVGLVLWFILSIVACVYSLTRSDRRILLPTTGLPDLPVGWNLVRVGAFEPVIDDVYNVRVLV